MQHADDPGELQPLQKWNVLALDHRQNAAHKCQPAQLAVEIGLPVGRHGALLQ